MASRSPKARRIASCVKCFIFSHTVLIRLAAVLIELNIPNVMILLKIFLSIDKLKSLLNFFFLPITLVMVGNIALALAPAYRRPIAMLSGRAKEDRWEKI